MTAASVERELRILDTNFTHQTFERVRPTGSNRNLGKVTLCFVFRKPSEVLVRDGCVGASRDLGDLDLAAPLADLDHEWNVLARRHVGNFELARRVAEADRDRLAREIAVTCFARGT